MLRSAFKAGETVPQTAPYWVHHYQHRLSHLSRLTKGEIFPSCRSCKDHVHFEHALDTGGKEIKSLQDDRDFVREQAATSGE